MATIFYKTGGDFSTLTPQKTLYDNVDSRCYDAAYSNSTAVNPTARTVAFTPSAAENVEGVWVQVRVGITSDVQTITVKLQEYVGSTWTDRATKSLTYNQIIGTEASNVESTTGANGCFRYFEFASPYAVTTASSTWRIEMSATDTNAYWCFVTAGNYVCAVVSQSTTSYSSTDKICVNNGINLAIDQTVNSANMMLGCDSTLSRASSPSTADTLTLPILYLSPGSFVSLGSSGARMAYAKQLTLALTSIRAPLVWAGDCPYKFEIYGELPTHIEATLAQTANSGQAKIVLTEDLSSDWQVGDVCCVLTNENASNHVTIQSFSGTEITFSSNLSKQAVSGLEVINITRSQQCGCKLTVGISLGNTAGLCRHFVMSGIYQQTYGIAFAYGYAATDAYCSTTSIGLVQPWLIEYISGGANIAVTSPGTTYSFSRNILINSRYNGSILRYRYAYTSGQGPLINIATRHSVDMDNLYFLKYLNAVIIGVDNSTIDKLVICMSTWSGSSYPYYSAIISGFGNTFTDCRANNVPFCIQGIGHTFSNLTLNAITSATDGAILFINNTVNTVFNNCNFGQTVANGQTIGVLQDTYVDCQFNNCKFDSTDIISTYGNLLLAGSEIRIVTHNQTANSHITYTKYGQTKSTGDGLADTTVHTSGTGKFAIRFLPTSSTSNREWSLTVPTGDISTKTMTVAVWCKINSANYYAGTNQLPRLTIDYDNGTTAYCQAAETTDWQLLFVTFTPTTTYGQITVTLSGRTDATDTDSYIYWDDFSVLYPAGYKLDLGGMDLWANAMPITPPIATVLSANDVWVVPKGSLTGTGTIGKHVKDQLDLNDIILGK